MEEVWKEVEGYEGIYEVSSKGRFRSLDRYVEYSDGRKPVFKKGRLINGNLTTDGYIRIKLNKNGKTKSMGLHRLVAIAFIPCDNKNEMEVNHIDCNRTNNCVENLEWVSHLENVKHSANKGHYSKSKLGSKNGRANYSEEDVKLMRELYDNGYTVMGIIKEMFPNDTYEERRSKWNCVKAIVLRKSYVEI